MVLHIVTHCFTYKILIYSHVKHVLGQKISNSFCTNAEFVYQYYSGIIVFAIELSLFLYVGIHDSIEQIALFYFIDEALIAIFMLTKIWYGSKNDW